MGRPRRFELFFMAIALSKSICWNENILLSANTFSTSHSSLITDFRSLAMLMCDWIDILNTRVKNRMKKSHSEHQACHDGMMPDLWSESQECASHKSCSRTQMHIAEEMLALK